MPSDADALAALQAELDEAKTLVTEANNAPQTVEKQRLQVVQPAHVSEPR